MAPDVITFVITSLFCACFRVSARLPSLRNLWPGHLPTWHPSRLDDESFYRLLPPRLSPQKLRRYGARGTTLQPLLLGNMACSAPRRLPSSPLFRSRSTRGLLNRPRIVRHSVVLRVYFFWQLFMTGQGHLAHIGKVADFFVSLGIPFPALNAYLSSTDERFFYQLHFCGSRLGGVDRLGA
jgi:hypothetical protein